MEIITDYKQLIDAVKDLDPNPGEIEDFAAAIDYPNSKPTVFSAEYAKNSTENIIISHPAFGGIGYLLTPNSVIALKKAIEDIVGSDIESYAGFEYALKKED